MEQVVFTPHIAHLRSGGVMSQPIFTACREGNTGAVVSLLQQPGGDPNVGEDGQPLLHLAVAGGHADVVRLLLSHPDLQVNRTDSAGLTGLHLACSQGRDKIVRILGGKTVRHFGLVNIGNFTLQSAVRLKWTSIRNVCRASTLSSQQRWKVLPTLSLPA